MIFANERSFYAMQVRSMETWLLGSDRRNPLAFDHNDGVFNRIGAAAVEHVTASQCTRRRRGRITVQVRISI